LKSLPSLLDLKIQLFDFQQEDLERPSWSFVGPTVGKLACIPAVWEILMVRRSTCFRWRSLRAIPTSTGIPRSTMHSAIQTLKLLFSATTSAKLYKYDLATLAEVSAFPISPIEVFDDHSDTIRDVTCHPWQSELAMTAR
jgi:hypothetical protein